MLEFTNEQFEDVKNKGETFYKSILARYIARIFKEKVPFKAQGLEHLKFKKKKFCSFLRMTNI